MLLFTLFSLSVLLVSSLYLGIGVWIIFSANPPLIRYFSFPYISTIHPYLTNLLSWHLSLSKSKEGGRRSLLSYDLHCSGHFLINAADKVVAHYNAKVTSYSKLETSSMIIDSLSSYPSFHLERLWVLWLILSSPRVTSLLGPMDHGIPILILQLFNFILGP